MRWICTICQCEFEMLAPNYNCPRCDTRYEYEEGMMPIVPETLQDKIRQMLEAEQCQTIPMSVSAPAATEAPSEPGTSTNISG
jgi:hypothetical protein